MLIKQATENDITLIYNLAQATWPVCYKDIITTGQIDYMLQLLYAPHQLKQQMQNGQRFFILYEKDGGVEKAIGFAAIEITDPLNLIYRLQKLYVLPTNQGTGAGRTLIDFVIKLAKSEGANMLDLLVNRKNIAIDFYKKTGFVIARQQDKAIGEGYFMRDYVMELPINAGVIS